MRIGEQDPREDPTLLLRRVDDKTSSLLDHQSQRGERGTRYTQYWRPLVHMPHQRGRACVDRVGLGVLGEELPQRVCLARLRQIHTVTSTRELGREWKPRETGRLHHEFDRLARPAGRAPHELVDAFLGLRHRERTAQPFSFFVHRCLVRSPKRDIDPDASHEYLLVDDRRGRNSTTVRAAQKGVSFAVTHERRASHLLNRARNSYDGRQRKHVRGRFRQAPPSSLTAVLHAGRETVAA